MSQLILTCDSNLLYKRFPEIAKTWHHEKNKGFNLETVTYGSDKKYYWICPTNPDHEWKTSPYDRSKCREVV